MMLDEIWQVTPMGRNYTKLLLDDNEESEPIVIAKQPCESASQPKRAKIAVDEQVLALEEHKVVALEKLAG